MLLTPTRNRTGTNMNHYEEHLAHSAPCNSRWDGFDRGDSGHDVDSPDERCIGRMTSEAGQRVSIYEINFGTDHEYSVYVDGARVFCELDCRHQAIQVARWWLAGCPA